MRQTIVIALSLPFIVVGLLFEFAVRGFQVGRKLYDIFFGD